MFPPLWTQIRSLPHLTSLTLRSGPNLPLHFELFPCLRKVDLSNYSIDTEGDGDDGWLPSTVEELRLEAVDGWNAAWLGEGFLSRVKVLVLERVVERELAIWNEVCEVCRSLQRHVSGLQYFAFAELGFSKRRPTPPRARPSRSRRSRSTCSRPGTSPRPISCPSRMTPSGRYYTPLLACPARPSGASRSCRSLRRSCSRLRASGSPRLSRTSGARSSGSSFSWAGARR